MDENPLDLITDELRNDVIKKLRAGSPSSAIHAYLCARALGPAFATKVIEACQRSLNQPPQGSRTLAEKVSDDSSDKHNAPGNTETAGNSATSSSTDSTVPEWTAFGKAIFNLFYLLGLVMAGTGVLVLLGILPTKKPVSQDQPKSKPVRAITEPLGEWNLDAINSAITRHGNLQGDRWTTRFWIPDPTGRTKGSMETRIYLSIDLIGMVIDHPRDASGIVQKGRFGSVEAASVCRGDPNVTANWVVPKDGSQTLDGRVSLGTIVARQPSSGCVYSLIGNWGQSDELKVSLIKAWRYEGESSDFSDVLDSAFRWFHHPNDALGPSRFEMTRVLMQKLNVENSQGSSYRSSQDIAQSMTDGLMAIDIQTCPAEFQLKFRDVIDAWSTGNRERINNANANLRKQCRELHVGTLGLL